MSNPQKYRKKPVVIEAMQWDGSALNATEIIDWVLSNEGTANYWCNPGCHETGEHNIAITTLEGKMLGKSGDFIIKGVNGEFYPCKPDIFAKTYEVA